MKRQPLTNPVISLDYNPDNALVIDVKKLENVQPKDKNKSIHTLRPERIDVGHQNHPDYVPTEDEIAGATKNLLWTAIRAMKQQLNEDFEKGLKNFTCGGLKSLYEMTSMIKKEGAGKASGPMIGAELGAVKISKNKIKSIIQSVSNVSGTELMKVNAITEEVYTKLDE